MAFIRFRKIQFSKVQHHCQTCLWHHVATFGGQQPTFSTDKRWQSEQNRVYSVVDNEKDLIELSIARFHSGGEISVIYLDVDATEGVQTEQVMRTRA